MGGCSIGRRFFDPERPIVLFKWTDVRPVESAESERLRANGAFWLPLANEPFDKTERGRKVVEVRQLTSRLDGLRSGRIAVLSRSYREPHLHAMTAARYEFPSLFAARRHPGGQSLLAEAALPDDASLPKREPCAEWIVSVLTADRATHVCNCDDSCEDRVGVHRCATCRKRWRVDVPFTIFARPVEVT